MAVLFILSLNAGGLPDSTIYFEELSQSRVNHLSGTELFKCMIFDAEGRQHWYQILFFHSSTTSLPNLKKSGQETIDLQIAVWLDTSLWVKDLSRKTDIQPMLDFICKFLNFVLWCLHRFRVFHFKNKNNKRKIETGFTICTFILDPGQKGREENKTQCFCLKSRHIWELALPIQRAKEELVKSRSEEPWWKTVNSCHLKTLNLNEIIFPEEMLSLNCKVWTWQLLSVHSWPRSSQSEKATTAIQSSLKSVLCSKLFSTSPLYFSKEANTQ